jgi:hypothetical protein
MSRKARRQGEIWGIATAAFAIAGTLGIVLGAPKPLQFQMMSGKVIEGEHGLWFASDDFRLEGRTGAQAPLVGVPCSKSGIFHEYFRSGQWGWKMHWRFEGAKIPPPIVKPRITISALECSIEVRRIIELRALK